MAVEDGLQLSFTGDAIPASSQTMSRLLFSIEARFLKAQQRLRVDRQRARAMSKVETRCGRGFPRSKTCGIVALGSACDEVSRFIIASLDSTRMISTLRVLRYY